MIFTILSFLLALGILVTIHEYGHFYIARRCGVKVLRFSVGFGKPIYTWLGRTGTEYTLGSIPLGGYVKMLDEREGDVAPEELSQAFTQKTVWQRMAIVVAGPVANFLLAICLYFILSLAGSTGVAPIVGDIPEDQLAATAGLNAGDEILQVDGQATTTWGQVYQRLTRRIGDTGSIRLSVQVKDSSIVETISLPIEQWLGHEDKPDILGSLGLETYVPKGDAVLGAILPDSPAEKAGLLEGDRVIQVGNQFIGSWRAWVQVVRANPETSLVVTVERNASTVKLDLIPAAIERGGESVGQAGVGSTLSWPENMIRRVEYSFSESISNGFTKTWDQSYMILSFIKKLLFAEVSTKNLSGSFTIAQVAGDSAKAGVLSYIAFLAFLSVSLGVFNLLPIPVLDGGHLLYYVIEAVKGSPVAENIQLVGYRIGLLLVLSMMVLAHVNDVVRLLA